MAKLFDMLKAQPAKAPIGDPQELQAKFKYWRKRTLIASMVGYAIFYFVRKNFSMAMPYFNQELGYSKTDLGMILFSFSIIYGLGKFVNGAFADRANPRFFMAIGLLGSAIVNIFFGLSSSLLFFGIFWLFNAFFQSMGWPPCARLLTYWFSRKERGLWFGVWNASHSIGGAGILILCGYLIPILGWRSAFFIPAFLAVITSIFLLYALRDTPASLGLPPADKKEPILTEEDTQTGAAPTYKDIFLKHVLYNPQVWLMSFANFFVYIVRIGILDWAPTFLMEAKGSSLAEAGWQVAAFEIAGIGGGVAAGAWSDKISGGKRGPINIIFSLGLLACILGLWLVPPGGKWLDGLMLMGAGFLVYGPQLLAGVAAVDSSSADAAGTATGMVGFFGYLGSAACALGTGIAVDRWGWDGGFLFYGSAALIATLIFAISLTIEGKKRAPH